MTIPEKNIVPELPLGGVAPIKEGVETAVAGSLAVSHHADAVELSMRLARDGATSHAAEELVACAAGGHGIGAWAAHYLLAKVSGQSAGTMEVETRDLAAFAAWFMQRHGHHADPGRIERWCEADTRHYLRDLEGQGRKPATINRILSSRRGFARWVHERPGGVFVQHGMPVADVKPWNVEEPECKELSEEQIAALFAMAQAAVNEEDDKARERSRTQPRSCAAKTRAAEYDRGAKDDGRKGGRAETGGKSVQSDDRGAVAR